jgi:parvulin-like peptidyl-prolyl isomerase
MARLRSIRPFRASRATTGIGAAVLAAVVVAAPAARGQLIDRILAVVAGRPITLSDVAAALRLGLVADGGEAGDGQQAVLNALIDRELQLVEVNRYLPPEPPAAEIDARVARVRARFDSQAAFDRALEETGVSAALLRAHIRDTLRIEGYLRQRFGASSQPSEDEILRYYRAHEAAFTANGALQPYASARDEARRRVIEERTASLVRDWMAGLRRRGNVTVLPK